MVLVDSTKKINFTSTKLLRDKKYMLQELVSFYKICIVTSYFQCMKAQFKHKIHLTVFML